MPRELYRTYEVLIEETVSPGDPRCGKTNKTSRYSAEITTALRDTNDIFQDAVCYYTLLLAGLVGNGDEGAGLNPLWRHLRSNAMKEQTDAVVKRLASRYPALQGLQTAEEFLDRVYGALQREHLLPAALQMTEAALNAAMKRHRTVTYQILEKHGTETDEATGEPKECQKLNVFASSWASILCNPTNATVIPGCGVYDSLLSRFQLREDWKPSSNDTQAWLGNNPSVVEMLIKEVSTVSKEAANANVRKYERQIKQDIAEMRADLAGC